jgi:amidophosphoribosyltransferase
MASSKEFIAHNKNTEEVAKSISADKLIYQDLDDLIWSVSQGNPEIKNFDCSCFDGEYVTGDISKEYLDHIESIRNDSAKLMHDINQSSELICEDIE